MNTKQQDSAEMPFRIIDAILGELEHEYWRNALEETRRVLAVAKIRGCDLKRFEKAVHLAEEAYRGEAGASLIERVRLRFAKKGSSRVLTERLEKTIRQLGADGFEAVACVQGWLPKEIDLRSQIIDAVFLRSEVGLSKKKRLSKSAASAAKRSPISIGQDA